MERDKFDLASRAFSEVLDSDKYEDEKAQRILTAMSFVTAAGVLLFSYLADQKAVVAVPAPFGLSIPFVTAWFLLFIALIAFGTMAFLTALGPRFNIPATWDSGAEPDQGSPKSRLFSKMIYEFGGKSGEDWNRYWQDRESGDIERQMTNDLVYEAFVLSPKVLRKTRWMRTGKPFYKAAVGALVVMSIPAATQSQSAVHASGAFVVCAWCVVEFIQDLPLFGAAKLFDSPYRVGLSVVGVAALVWGLFQL